MNNLEFRIWDEDIKHYINHENSDQFAIGLNGKVIDIGCKFTSQIKEVSKGIVIEQFTGLADTNGVKIFEGDRIAALNIACEVRLKDGAFVISIGNFHRIKISSQYLIDNGFSVIGNIHENKDE